MFNEKRIPVGLILALVAGTLLGLVLVLAYCTGAYTRTKPVESSTYIFEGAVRGLPVRMVEEPLGGKTLREVSIDLSKNPDSFAKNVSGRMIVGDDSGWIKMVVCKEHNRCDEVFFDGARWVPDVLSPDDIVDAQEALLFALTWIRDEQSRVRNLNVRMV